MITVAIHSPNNPDILIAMRDVLVLCGLKNDINWNEAMNPLRVPVIDSLHIIDGFLIYASHQDYVQIKYPEPLTRKNFGDVLNFVLLCQIWEEIKP